MTLGIFLAMGDSFKNMVNVGQDELFKKFYLSYFSENFDKIYVFSYDDEKVKNLPKNVEVIGNKLHLHRYLYGFLMPFLNFSKISACDIFRVYHLFGTLPAILCKLVFNKSFIFNFAYDYEEFAVIEGKHIQRLFLGFLKPASIFFASKIFAANKVILTQLPSQKAIYMPNGVDTIFFKPIKRRKINKIPLVLSVGRLEKQKNFESLVASMKNVNANLKIVGSGSLKPKLLKMARQTKINLILVPKISHLHMPPIYNSADIFVLPSFVEGSPKVLLEAMACGLPVIAAKADGTEEIITNKNGILVSSDPASINRAIKRLLTNQNLRKNISIFARDHIISRYNLAKLLKTEIDILKKVAIR